MRIAVWHNLPGGGGKRALYDQVRGLVARGHTLEVWCPPTADRSYLPLSNYALEHVVPLQWYTPTSAASRLHPAYWNMAAKIKAMDEHCRICAREMAQRGFDLLLGASCYIFTTTAIGSLAPFPSVLYLQEPNRAMYEATPQLIWAAPKLPGPAWAPAHLRALLADNARVLMMRDKVRAEIDNAAAYDRILVNSYFSRESVLRSYGLDAQVCYLGVDMDHFSDRRLPRESFVIGVGAITPRKNIEFLIGALGLMEQPPAFVWVGNSADTGYLQALQSLAAEHQVKFRVEVNVSDAALVDLLSRAAAMVYAPRLEPFGYAPLEANAAGCPVVTVLEGGMRETVIDGVNGLVTAPEPGAFAGALTALLHDAELARRLGRQARRYVEEHWTLAAAIDRLEQHLRAVAAQ